MNLFAVHKAEGMILEIRTTEPEFVDQVLSVLGLNSTRFEGAPFTRRGIQWNDI